MIDRSMAKKAIRLKNVQLSNNGEMINDGSSALVSDGCASDSSNGQRDNVRFQKGSWTSSVL